jgi:hypothetical protein
LRDEPARREAVAVRDDYEKSPAQPAWLQPSAEHPASAGVAIAGAAPASIPAHDPGEPLAEDIFTTAAAAAAQPVIDTPDREPDVAISDAERAVIVDVMRVAPDVRYRAARSLDLLGGLEDTYGVVREHALLGRARSSGKLIALAEAVAR